MKKLGTHQQQRRNARGGFTLLEVLVVAAISGIVGLALSVLIMTSWKGFTTEMRQNESCWRARQVIASFRDDAAGASQVVYSGSSAFTLPTLTGSATYNLPSGLSSAVVPGGTKLVVLQLPSYDSNGVIPNSYDYVGYTWTAAGNNVPGQTFRTCIPTTGSSRVPFYALVPGGGDYDSQVNFSFRVNAGYVDPTYGTVFQRLTYADSATYNSISMFQGSSPLIALSNIDQVDLDITVSGTAFGLSLKQELTANATLRSWGRNSGTSALTAPTAPTGLSITKTVLSGYSAQITLSWTSSSSAVSYNIMRSQTSGGPYAVVAEGIPVSYYTDYTASTGTTYYYAVSAVNGAGESPDSSQASVSTGSSGTPVAPPSNLAATQTVQTGQIYLAWNQSTSASVTQNRIYRSTHANGNGTYSLLATIPADTSYTDTTARSGTNYYYYVTAVNTNGQESAYSNQANATPK